MAVSSYLLQVGKKDEERLSLLNELFGETSRLWLQKAGIKPGMKVLEVGCGTGNMTSWLAEQVGKNGQVTALDVSQDQVDIAKIKNAAHHNITYTVQSIFDMDLLPQYDLIYSRFVIMHQTAPEKALEILSQLLLPGGVMVCEEGTNSVAECYPSSPVFQKYRALLTALFEAKNIDNDIGKKIYGYFRTLKLKNIAVNFVQPLYQYMHQKKIMYLFIQEMKDSYLKNNLINEKEINQLILDMKAFIENDDYLVSFIRTTQIFGVK